MAVETSGRSFTVCEALVGCGVALPCCTSAEAVDEIKGFLNQQLPHLIVVWVCCRLSVRRLNDSRLGTYSQSGARGWVLDELAQTP